MSTKLNFDFKHGKRTVGVWVEGETTEEAFSQYTNALNHVQQLEGSAAPTPTKTKATADPTPSDTAAEIPQEQVKPAGKREQKKTEEMAARAANENALKWFRRLSTSVPHFAGKQPQTIAEEMGSRKAMALMTAQESDDLAQLAINAIKTYAYIHADVNAYLLILNLIDSLETGSDQEWEAKKASIAADKWAFLGQNRPLFDAAKQELEDTRKLLQVAALAG